jgi:hypothetical protein
MKKSTGPASIVLVGIAFLLSVLFMQAAVAQIDSVQPLEKITKFHNRFKDPSSLDKGSELSPADARLMNNNTIPGVFREQLSGLVVVNGERHGSIAPGGLVWTSPSNFMDIDVSGITVIAISMGKGQAVATSDIVLSPIQYQMCTSSGAEVAERLK